MLRMNNACVNPQLNRDKHAISIMTRIPSDIAITDIWAVESMLPPDNDRGGGPFICIRIRQRNNESFTDGNDGALRMNTFRKRRPLDYWMESKWWGL
ncbi:hypothetical protein AVEN_206186-1 [Araneus ventricosus]|uniref:Uncharacterized protein n=1 Tax=Araneus ventricosus TaxID=182803 RepID=A0A4Y2EE07_ARAVE|nr:hypothetical protein AVEN_206186-1 [Araneus ventricosus]